MSTDAFRAAEKRGYSKGYAAGQRRKQRNIDDDRRSRERAAFWNRAFLAALPACLTVDSWKNGKGEPITTLDQRVQLASNCADRALERRREWA